MKGLGNHDAVMDDAVSAMYAMTSAEEIRRNLLKLENQLGAESLRSLLDETVSYLAAVRERLDRYRHANEWDAVARQLHQLKGSLVIYGSSELRQLLLVFQEAGRLQDNVQLVDAVSVKLAEAEAVVRQRIDEME